MGVLSRKVVARWRGHAVGLGGASVLHAVLAPPVPGRGHQPCRVAVLPIPAQPPRRGGAARRAGHRRQLSYETIRRWCHKFGQAFAQGVRRRRPRPGDKWHVDEVQLKINGRTDWLWRAVDQEGVVLDILVQERRNQEAAEAFLRRVIDGCGYTPRVTDKLASYLPAIRCVLPGVEHRRHKGVNNRAENSHRPLRKRERVLQRFKSPEHAQQFLEPFSAVHNHFRPRRHLFSADQYRQIRAERFQQWRDVARLQPAA
jgi:putative transposase